MCAPSALCFSGPLDGWKLLNTKQTFEEIGFRNVRSFFSYATHSKSAGVDGEGR